MENLEASRALENADRLSSKARQAGRWYARFLILFAVASALFASSFTLVSDKAGSLAMTGVFLAVTFVLLGWAQRQKTVLAGMGRVHSAVMLCWGLLWAVTVVVGSEVFPGEPAWWISGALAMAAPCLVGAHVTYRRTS